MNLLAGRELRWKINIPHDAGVFKRQQVHRCALQQFTRAIIAAQLAKWFAQSGGKADRVAGLLRIAGAHDRVLPQGIRHLSENVGADERHIGQVDQPALPVRRGRNACGD
ncbi:Uncharacterised protein [Serratia marcescens]|uniref:Uncharacterized protein n=1 Tax=Serratia marcescens TaxID=615 RepID=A0A379YKD4_SERMA|nr:Uncharacterised protein [Serratia marcescens]